MYASMFVVLTVHVWVCVSTSENHNCKKNEDKKTTHL